MNDEQRIQRVLGELEKTEDERLIELGRAMTPAGLGIQENSDDLIESGRQFLGRVLDNLQDQVCCSSTIQMLHEKTIPNNSALILALLDVVAKILSGPEIFTVTASIFHHGIGRLCKTYWATE